MHMVDLETFTRPSALLKRLSPERRTMAAEAFWRDENAGGEQAEALAAIASRIKFRPKSVRAMPVEKKARQLLALPALSEMLAIRILVSYHLQHHTPMMGSFLDALGIAHENGLIADEDLTAPPAERLAEAARTLAGTYTPDDAAVYLSTLVWQDPETWGGLADLPEVRPQPEPDTSHA
jgi:hypothetical protein